MFLCTRLGPAPGLVRKCSNSRQLFTSAGNHSEHGHIRSVQSMNAASGSAASTVAAPSSTDSNLKSESRSGNISTLGSTTDVAVVPVSLPKARTAGPQVSTPAETSSDVTQQAASDRDHTTQNLPSSSNQSPVVAVNPAAPTPARKQQSAAAKVKAPSATVAAEGKQAVTARKQQVAAATRRIVSQLAATGTAPPSPNPATSKPAPASPSDSVPPRKTPVRGSRVSRRGVPKTAAQDSAQSLPGADSSASSSSSSSSSDAGSDKALDGLSLASTSTEPAKTTNRRLFRQQPKTVKPLPAAPITGSVEDIRQLIKPLPAASAISVEETRQAAILAAQTQRVLDLNLPQGGLARAADQSGEAQEVKSVDSVSQPGRYYSERSNRRYQYATMIMKRKVKQPMPAAALAAIASPDLEELETSLDAPTFLPSGPRRSARSKPFVVGSDSSESSSRQSASMFVSRNRKLLLQDAKRLREVGTSNSEPNPELDIRAEFEMWIQQVIRPEEPSSSEPSPSSSGAEFIPQQFNMLASDGSRSSLGSIDFADDYDFSRPAALDPALSATADKTQAEQEAASVAVAAAAAAVATARRAEAEELEEDEEVDGDGAVQEPGQNDKRGKYDPRVEAVNDVVNIMLGIKLPENAFYGQRALQLAEMKDADVKASCAVWLSALGPDFAAAFIGREGTLLLRHPSQMLSLFDALTSSLGLLPQQCVKFSLQHPFLISWYNSDRDLEALLSKLGQILQVDRLKAVRCVMHSPKLLQLTPEFLSAKAESLSTIFPIDSDEMSALLTKRPRLLLRAPASIASTMVSVAKTLQIPVYDVAVMIAATPGILGTSNESITTRWSLLCELTDRHPPWAEQLAILSLPSLGRCLASSTSAIERLDHVLQSNMTDMPALLKFKKIISLSNTVYNSLKAEHERLSIAPLEKAKADSSAPKRYSYRDYSSGMEGQAPPRSKTQQALQPAGTAAYVPKPVKMPKLIA